MAGKTIALELSLHQYRHLIRLVFAGYWVLEREENEQGVDPVAEETLNTVLKRAFEAGMKKEISYDSDLQMYVCAAEMEDAVLQGVDQFVTDEFWTELRERLSERDLIHKLGQARFNHMNDHERIAALKILEEYYAREFESYGVDRLHVQSVAPLGAEA
jgi:hypothetical protein